MSLELMNVTLCVLYSTLKTKATILGILQSRRTLHVILEFIFVCIIMVRQDC